MTGQEDTLTIDRLSFQLDVLDSYLALKRRRAELEEAGKFDSAAAREISRRCDRRKIVETAAGITLHADRLK